MKAVKSAWELISSAILYFGIPAVAVIGWTEALQHDYGWELGGDAAIAIAFITGVLLYQRSRERSREEEALRSEMRKLVQSAWNQGYDEGLGTGFASGKDADLPSEEDEELAATRQQKWDDFVDRERLRESGEGYSKASLWWSPSVYDDV